MARATKAEIAQRLREICPLVADCMTLREIRAWVKAKTEWGPRSLTPLEVLRQARAERS